MKPRVRTLVLFGLGAVALAATAAAGLFAWAQRTVTTPFPPAGVGLPQRVDIEPGQSAATILEKLETAGIVPRADLARLVLLRLGDPPLQAGEYLFEHPATSREVIGRLVSGDVVQHFVTVLEGLTLEETAALLAAEGFGDQEAFVAAMRRPELIADLDSAAETLEGYLFPDTYAFPRGTSEVRIVEEMVANFRRRFAAGVVARTGAAADVRATVTLASIVEREATLDSERPVIAGVYANRLRLGIGLYADPTVIYALKQQGVWDGNLRRRDLELDSPYNTYRYPGLPPGPICSPGSASLQAAASPAAVPYLYFVSRNDGSHVFAETLAEHNRNVEIWQRRYFRERARRDAAESQVPPAD
ncbi:MAG TPA: endolytic transglycosylase MltG [Thermoanaerobaculia bacterium]|nr:endolytic transglycosylase MltG [Thermoanaerobaculia bacterium]